MDISNYKIIFHFEMWGSGILLIHMYACSLCVWNCSYISIAPSHHQWYSSSKSITANLWVSHPAWKKALNDKHCSNRDSLFYSLPVFFTQFFLRLQLHGAIYCPDSFVFIPPYCANLKAIRYESTSFNRIVADKSHRVIAALSFVSRGKQYLLWCFQFGRKSSVIQKAR